jgi:hypothetical protein
LDSQFEYGRIPNLRVRAPEFFQPFFDLFFETTLLCADFNRFFLRAKNRDDDFSVDLSSSAIQVVNPAHGCPIVANWYDEISIFYGIRAPLSH